mmetsp:Transcript_22760/g.63996  ORF Transcript_22760/g.63996 Transcript_22760/m.63996 type:complete len:130 (+) Transcript_22760:62-451(+)|eukprot:CAMPEP_0119119030 /NCGR_PEP_ID=MMETSP1310-20130426/702_1 /TAXON_ID=464262 /ORGANISM="Genus nov. species nov., Strain RCC2339" /LENGTH=129 /DNA_ID=CAMNT_0007108441 /DNA_START=62 /DNA_END=451 /DNA_ORIENTATION=+
MSFTWPGIPPSSTVLHRDWARAGITQFEAEFPASLEGKVSPEEFRETIDEVNHLLRCADNYGVCGYLEGLVACASFFSIYICYEGRSAGFARQLKEFLKEQNRSIYAKAGLEWKNPFDNGLLYLEISEN